MVRINGKSFTVYTLDTKEGVIDRVAALYKSLPRYLYFPNGVPTLEQLRTPKLDITVDNSLDVLINAESIGEVVNYFSTRMVQQDLSWVADVFTPYIFLNKTLREYPPDTVDLFILNARDELHSGGYMTDREVLMFDPVRTWKDRKNLVSVLNRERETLRKTANEHANLLAQFDAVETPAISTAFTPEIIKLEFPIYFENPSPLSIFDRVVLNDKVPFATCRGFYKVFRDSIPQQEWLTAPSPDTGIYLKVLQSTYPKLRYSDALVNVEEDGVRVYADITVGKGTVTRDEAVAEIVSIFSDVEIGEVVESTVKGHFYLPKRSLNNDVFADLAMNNPLFSYVIVVNERDKASKDKNDIQIRFIHPLVGTLNVYITEYQQTEKTPKALRPVLGQTYVRVTISEAPNTDNANMFREVFAKLMVFYDREYDDIIQIYKSLLGSKFATKTTKKKSKKAPEEDDNPLRRDYPNVFRPFYSRWCREERMPSIISDEDAENARAEGTQVMEFPKEGTAGYPKLNVVCNSSPTHKYPGLIVNKTDNANDLPFMPCCYVNDQSRGKSYKSYFQGSSISESDSKRRVVDNIFKDGKIVPVDKTGYLPINIREFFWTVDIDDEYEYLRSGSHHTKSSFLDCVLRAMDIDGISEINDPDERMIKLAEVRENLAIPELAAVCKQQMYDSSIEQIMESIRNPDIYFDPRLFIPLVQEVYNCNVFLFSKRVPTGTLELPRHTNGLFYTERPAPTILILEHSGSESDKAQFPQCELIVRWNKTDSTDVMNTFDYNTTPIPQLRMVFSQMRTVYALDKPIPFTKFLPTPLPFSVTGQSFDSYGKCRLITAMYKKKPVSIATSPIPPLLAMPVAFEDAPRVDVKTGLELAGSMSMTLTGQLVDDFGVMRALVGTVGNVNVSILLEDSEEIQGLPTYEEGVGIQDPNKSALTDFQTNKRIAFFLTQYAMWLYSTYINGEYPTIDRIISFAENNINIDSSYERPSMIERKFSLDSPILDDGKLVVNSFDEAQRLVYTLRVAIARNPDGVISFRERAIMEDFYDTVLDFKTYPNQIIAKGEDTLRQWVEDTGRSRVLHSSLVVYLNSITEMGVETMITLSTDKEISESQELVTAGEQHRLANTLEELIEKARIEVNSAKGISARLEAQEKLNKLEEKAEFSGTRISIVEGYPYFLMNELIAPDTVFLAQNTDTIAKAITIAETWYSKGYNIGKNAMPSDSTKGFTFFSYVNENNITRYNYTGTGPPLYPIKIMGYLIGGIKYLTVLMDL